MGIIRSFSFCLIWGLASAQQSLKPFIQEAEYFQEFFDVDTAGQSPFSDDGTTNQLGFLAPGEWYTYATGPGAELETWVTYMASVGYKSEDPNCTQDLAGERCFPVNLAMYLAPGQGDCDAPYGGGIFKGEDIETEDEYIFEPFPAATAFTFPADEDEGWTLCFDEASWVNVDAIVFHLPDVYELAEELWTTFTLPEARGADAATLIEAEEFWRWTEGGDPGPYGTFQQPEALQLGSLNAGDSFSYSVEAPLNGTFGVTYSLATTGDGGEQSLYLVEGQDCSVEERAGVLQEEVATVEFDNFAGSEMDLVPGPHTLTLCVAEASGLIIDSFSMDLVNVPEPPSMIAPTPAPADSQDDPTATPAPTPPPNQEDPPLPSYQVTLVSTLEGESAATFLAPEQAAFEKAVMEVTGFPNEIQSVRNAPQEEGRLRRRLQSAPAAEVTYVVSDMPTEAIGRAVSNQLRSIAGSFRVLDEYNALLEEEGIQSRVTGITTEEAGNTREIPPPSTGGGGGGGLGAGAIVGIVFAIAVVASLVAAAWCYYTRAQGKPDSLQAGSGSGSRKGQEVEAFGKPKGAQPGAELPPAPMAPAPVANIYRPQSQGFASTTNSSERVLPASLSSNGSSSYGSYGYGAAPPPPPPSASPAVNSGAFTAAPSTSTSSSVQGSFGVAAPPSLSSRSAASPAAIAALGGMSESSQTSESYRPGRGLTLLVSQLDGMSFPGALGSMNIHALLGRTLEQMRDLFEWGGHLSEVEEWGEAMVKGLEGSSGKMQGMPSHGSIINSDLAKVKSSLLQLQQVLRTLHSDSSFQDRLVQKNCNGALAALADVQRVLENEISPEEIILADEPLAIGGYSRVYLAEYRGQTVCAKVFKLQEGAEKVSFWNELGFLKQLQHPNIVTTYGAANLRIESRECAALVMEYMPEGDLGDLLRDRPQELNADVEWRLLHDITCGMEYVHENGVQHRDLKSANILLKVGNHGELRAKVADLGIAKSASSAKTTVQHLKGFSPEWAPPEVVRQVLGSKGVTQRTLASDVYSFAIIMWEVVSKQQPWADVLPDASMGQRVLAIAVGVEGGERPAMPPNVMPGMVSLIQDCWEDDQGLRPSFSQVRQALETGLWGKKLLWPNDD